MSVRVQCPSCGGPVVFEVGSSMVAVCPYCRSAVARGDRSVEDLGKVAALVDSGAILSVGLAGKFDGTGFRLTGRVQLAHEAGGVWDEWYAAFDDGRWGWLSEAQGRFYLLFEQPPGERPDLGSLQVGTRLRIAGERLTVNETGTATARGAEGEIPYRLIPGSTYQYADLSGPESAFATLDFSESPARLFLGRQVTLDELGVPPNLRKEAFELREVAAKRVACPNCGGPLDLRAPDRTERVGCPYCGSLLDATRGELSLLNALKDPPFALLIPLGAKGTFGTDERTVIGAIERSVTYDGVDYTWQEYLLYHPRDGFEWLLRNDNHWTRVKPVPPADVDEGKTRAVYDGRSFKKFQAATATVRGVIGECYWKVSVGETAETADFIRPPELLSREQSTFGSSEEVNWSVGTYLTPAEVKKAFGLTEALPAPVGVAPNQPFPYTGVYKLGLAFFAALCVTALLMLVTLPQRKVHEQTFELWPLGTSPRPAAGTAPPAAPEKTQIFFTDLFELKGRQNVYVTVSCPNLVGWLIVEGDLVQQSNGQVQPFLVPLTYYSGTEDGEGWSEGDRTGSVFVPAQPAGQYSLRLEVEREQAQLAGTMTVKVQQGVPHLKNWLLALAGLAVVPGCVAVYHLIFVSRRWQNSDFPMVATESGPSGDAEAEGEPEEPPAGESGRPVAKPVRKKKGKKRRPEE